MESVRVLFVDDEPGIRLTMPQTLEQHGFSVTAVGTVNEALAEIMSAQFDVLLSDLNIGQPSDGFTVVSAMRRTQPECVTLSFALPTASWLAASGEAGPSSLRPTGPRAYFSIVSSE